MHSASVLAVAIAGTIGIVAPVYPLIFDGIAPHTKQVIDFTAFVVGAFSSVLGLYDLSKNYLEKARQFHECGKAVNRVVRRLDIVPNSGIITLIEEYEKAIDACQENHDDIDYEIARVQWDAKSSKGRAQRGKLLLLKFQAWIAACWLYLLAWIGPIGLAFYL